jgi:uncharacterized membrane protein YcaP (DUF421 family)
MVPLYIPVIKSIILVASGMLLLRLAGRKSISQMTVGQTVVIISIGSIIIEPIITDRILNTLVAALTFILFLIITEFLEVKYPIVENFLSGKAKVIIDEGKLHEENLRKLRLTVDKLEMRLRQQGITNIADLQTATLEPNGQIGYELKRSAKPLTIGEFEKAIGYLFKDKYHRLAENNRNIFDEIKEDQHKTKTPHELE